MAFRGGTTETALQRLPQDAYRRIGEFRQALREFLVFSEAGAREHGLTSQQHQALLAIKSHEGPDPMTVSELAERLLIKTHSAVGLVARLVERALVARRVSRADRRRVQLILTDEGEGVLEAITGRNLDQLEGVAETLDELLQTARRLQRDAPRS
jgi:DNA-binding MarR family transcriptional regulator